jgi:ribonuclease BN (tRNA processing enzyme)
MRIAFFGTCGAIPTADNGNTSFLVDASGQLIMVEASPDLMKEEASRAFRGEIVIPQLYSWYDL